MKKIQDKTPAMLRIEEEFGKPIEEILRHMYVDDRLNHVQMIARLGISYPTLIKWLKLAGVRSRRLNVHGVRLFL